MLARDIIKAVCASPAALADESLLDKNYTYAFATDLMSDALAMLSDTEESVVLITGLANEQALRTAEMLDIDMIIMVRDKKMPASMLETAESIGCNVFITKKTMYETCGALYTTGFGVMP